MYVRVAYSAYILNKNKLLFTMHRLSDLSNNLIMMILKQILQIICYKNHDYLCEIVG